MAYTRPWPLPPRDATTIHHLTDTHVGYGDPYGIDDQAKLLAVGRDVQSVFIRHIDGYVHTGDITDDGGGTSGIESTQDGRALEFLESIDTGKPNVWAPGNHDFWDRDGFIGSNEPYTAAAWEYAYGRPANGTVDIGDVRVVYFSPTSLIRGDSWTISGPRLNWIDRQCQNSDRPVVLANHYPLAELDEQNGFAVGSHVHPRTELANIIDANPNVIGMLTGHKHFATTAVRSVDVLTVGARNIVHLCGPSLAFTGPPDHAGYGDAAPIPQRSLYVSIVDETTWDIRYRTHTPRRWDDVDGWRVTTADSATGDVTHSQGGSA